MVNLCGVNKRMNFVCPFLNDDQDFLSSRKDKNLSNGM